MDHCVCAFELDFTPWDKCDDTSVLFLYFIVLKITIYDMFCCCCCCCCVMFCCFVTIATDFAFFGLSETARISHVDIELSTACTHMMYTYREQKKVPPLTAYHKRWNLCRKQCKDFYRKWTQVSMVAMTHYHGTHRKKSEIQWMWSLKNRMESLAQESDEWQATCCLDLVSCSSLYNSLVSCYCFCGCCFISFFHSYPLAIVVAVVGFIID